MMIVNTVRNVSQALSAGLSLLSSDDAEEAGSRNGPVRTWLGPVVTVTERPMERVLGSQLRNANPFFHLFESLWMLAGRNDLAWLVQFNKQMAAYSDDEGATQPAAYGHRWRSHFALDQLSALAEHLRNDPNSRRAVLNMWDVAIDTPKLLPGATTADVPCNTTVYFRIMGGRLNMTVSCRSNDVWWGAHGANAVHFSILQEYMAALIGVPMGYMYQLSNDYHVYTDIVPENMADVAREVLLTDLYTTRENMSPTTIFETNTMQSFATDLHRFMDYAAPNHVAGLVPLLHHRFLARTAVPMLRAWRAHKNRDYDYARSVIARADGADWRAACTQWLRNAQNKYNRSNPL